MRRRVLLTERDGFGGRRTYVVDVFRASAAQSALPTGHQRELRSECVAVPPSGRASPKPLATHRRRNTRYTAPMGSIYYTTKGPLRGRCGHSHNHILAAVQCRDADEARCVALGGHTDRRIYVGGRGQAWALWRELDEVEVQAVVALRGDVER